MREYEAKPPDRRGDRAGRLEVWRNDDGTWSARLQNAQGTCSFAAAGLDAHEVRGWIDDHLAGALAAAGGDELDRWLGSV